MATSKQAVDSPLTLTEIPEHLQAEIFLRLPTPEDVARTSAACATFRRIVADRSFRRLFRRLHAAPLLGFLHPSGFHPALPPAPAAPAARALALAADFSFSFLPSHCDWSIRDTREGRVLLDRIPKPRENIVFTDLVVCDPLFRRYLLLPPVPDDLAALVGDPVPIFSRRYCEPSLIPPFREEAAAAAEETVFRVMWLARSDIKLTILVFSSSTGQWQIAASQGLSDLLVGKGQLPPLHPIVLQRHYACGRFYWEWLTDKKSKELLVLDIQRMEFSTADLPPGGWNMADIAIVEAGEGKLGIFGILNETSDDLCYAIGPNQGEDFSKWQMEKKISLDSGYRHSIGTAKGRYLLLEREVARLYASFSLPLLNPADSLSGLAHRGHTYTPASHHRCCCLHQQYELHNLTIEDMHGSEQNRRRIVRQQRWI